jgi:hypothetical protein
MRIIPGWNLATNLKAWRHFEFREWMTNAPGRLFARISALWQPGLLIKSLLIHRDDDNDGDPWSRAVTFYDIAQWSSICGNISQITRSHDNDKIIIITTRRYFH